MPRYIDADKFMREFINEEWGTNVSFSSVDNIVEKLIKEARDVAPVIHAKWIEDGYQDEPYVCSNCGWAENDDMHRITGAYCVCCGAKMDEEE